MKNSIYTLFILATLLTFSACNDENVPGADFRTYEASNLQVVAGDGEVSLSWEALEGSDPVGYYLMWTPSSLTVEGGDLSVEATLKATTITDLVNGEPYTFSVQPVYANGKRGGQITAQATPVSTRLPVTDLIVAAGDQKVRLRWTKPEREDLKEYKLLISNVEDPVIISRELESYEVTGLTNDTEYEFSLICVYPNGTSNAVYAKATPGQVYPIIVASTGLTLNEPCTFTCNDMYFTMGTIASVTWDFGDGNTSAENEPVHSFATTGNYTVEITVMYEDGTSEKGTIVMEVAGYAWESMKLNYNGLSGYVKVSNPVFSPDGRTLYIPTSTPQGHLFAVDVVTGTVKWASEITPVTYGGGALVDGNGVIYQGGTDGIVYAINPEDGSKKWTYDTKAAIGAFPALSGDGILYCLTNKGMVYALQTATGVVTWSKEIGGSTGSALAVDAEGNVYAGTNVAIHKLSSSGEELWKTSGINVTERGAFAMDAAGTTIYATQKSSAGLVAIDMATGTVKWTYPNTGGGDAYLPVAGPDGKVYFTDKGGMKVYAIHSNGTLGWEKSLGAALTYCGLVIADNGKIYCATQGQTAKDIYSVYGLNTQTGEVDLKYDNEEQFMAAASIGPDKRLYIGTIGKNDIGSLLAIPVDGGPETSSWSTRGSNIHGTNRK